MSVQSAAVTAATTATALAAGAAGELETAEDIGQLETAAPPKAKRARKS